MFYRYEDKVIHPLITPLHRNQWRETLFLRKDCDTCHMSADCVHCELFLNDMTEEMNGIQWRQRPQNSKLWSNILKKTVTRREVHVRLPMENTFILGEDFCGFLNPLRSDSSFSMPLPPPSYSNSTFMIIFSSHSTLENPQQLRQHR